MGESGELLNGCAWLLNLLQSCPTLGGLAALQATIGYRVSGGRRKSSGDRRCWLHNNVNKSMSQKRIL